MDADHISRQTNLPQATPSERLETQEFNPTYPFPQPLDQWQHLISHEDRTCMPLDRCSPCVQAMSQQGVVKTLPLFREEGYLNTSRSLSRAFVHHSFVRHIKRQSLHANNKDDLAN